MSSLQRAARTIEMLPTLSYAYIKMLLYIELITIGICMI